MKSEKSTLMRTSLMASASAFVLALSPLVPAAHAIVPNDNYTPDDIIDDEVDITGVGMFYRADGFVCTGTLINPRTVLFAAHCVNDLPEGVYGSQLPAAFSFGSDALPGFIDWINGGFATNAGSFVYNISQIQYHPDSLTNPNGFGFLEGDIALATLDTPAADIPTWALLFSALPAPNQDPVTGSGYHVKLNGYGRSGSGTTGASQGIDWRRRAAENMIGALASIDDRNAWLFGIPDSGLPQNLYRLDFDDPNKTNPFDFNLWQDEPLEREATTAGGDSGGPLILDAANNDITDEDLVIGVLSGGSRFFGPQVFSSYGTESFYQPLYLFYDYIAAVNPYRYVSAVEGDGAWEDGSHWVSDLDPNYRIIDANGNIVNGVPGEASDGVLGTDPTWGVICFDQEGDNPGDECFDLATNEPVPPSRPLPPEEEAAAGAGANVANNIGRVQLAENAAIKGGLTFADDIAISAGLTLVEDVAIKTGVDLADDTAITTGVELAEETPHAGPLPDPTIENGLPGATGFIPDNVEPDNIAGVYGRYFDVTLANAGTTTLSSYVQIDRLTVTGAATTKLQVNDGAGLWSMMDITQTGGVIDVAAGGNIGSVGDYLLFQGLLSGSGTVTSPYLTNVGGMIAPGGMGTAGTLTVNGNVVLSSASYLLTDIVGSTNDLLVVNGDASLGGTIALGFVGATPTYGSSYTVASISGDMLGGFDAVTGLGDGVLTGSVSYWGDSVIVSVEAVPFLDFLPSGLTGTQQSYAAAFDVARADNYAGLSSIYSLIDLMGPADVLASFDQMAADDAVLASQGASAIGDVISGQINDRLDAIRGGATGFTATASSSAIQVASVDPMAAFSFAANNATMAAAEETTSKTWDMKPGYGGFIDVDFFTGETLTGIAGREGDIEGFSVAAGLDRTFDDGNTFGAFVTYAQTENTVDQTAVTSADIDGFSVGAYGEVQIPMDLYLNGYVSYGNYSVDTMRVASIGGSSFTAEGNTDMTGAQLGLEIGRELTLSERVTLTPSVAADRMDFTFDDYSESGSAIALDVEGRSVTSLLVSAGADLDVKATENGRVSFNLGARIVNDMGDGSEPVIGVFSAAPTTTSVVLSGPSRDRTWYEVEAGIDFKLTDTMTGGLNVRTDLDRDDMDQTIIGGTLSVKF